VLTVGYGYGCGHAARCWVGLGSRARVCGVETTGRRSAQAHAAQRHVEGRRTADGMGVRASGKGQTGTRAGFPNDCHVAGARRERTAAGSFGLLGTRRQISASGGPFVASARTEDGTRGAANRHNHGPSPRIPSVVGLRLGL
jgi:hypothetical protein